MYLLLAVSMLACLLGTILKKQWSRQYPENAFMLHLFNAAISIVSAASLWALTGFQRMQISRFTLLLGILFGVVTALQAIFHLKAFEKGPFSYTSVLVSLSTIIPALSGALLWNETVTAVQIVGILFMLICFACSVEPTSSEKKATLSWFLYVGLAFLLTGLIGVLQKWHQNTAYKNELDGFLIIAFLMSFLYSLLCILLLRSKPKKSDQDPSIRLRGHALTSAILLMAVAGICVAANNKINLYLSGVMDSAVFFPTVNGGGLILSTLAALLLFREKPSKKQWLGIAFGIVAVVLLCNPF